MGYVDADSTIDSEKLTSMILASSSLAAKRLESDPRVAISGLLKRDQAGLTLAFSRTVGSFNLIQAFLEASFE
jgi:ABC-type sulfate transport system permease component